MKQLRLNLKKNIIILERPDKCDITITKEGIYFYLLNKDEKIFIEGKFKLICEWASDLTEETAAGMVHQEQIDSSPTYMQYDCTCNNYFDENLSALESFISAIEAQSRYWGCNPFDHVDPENSIYESDLVLFDKDLKRWKDAESRTFHPERTIIFEMV